MPKRRYVVTVKDFSFEAEAPEKDWISQRISRALRGLGFTDVSLEVEAIQIKRGGRK